MSDQLDFDRACLAGQLGRLSPHLRVAFAAACAERLYQRFAAFERRFGRGAPGELRAMLDRLWAMAEAREGPGEWTRQSLARVDALTPGWDPNVWLPGQDEADDFTMALAYAFEALEDDGGEAASWAAERAYDACDRIIQNRPGHDPNASGAEEVALHDPIVQAELARQHRDLEELLRGPDTPELVRRLRERAQQESVPSDTP